MAGMNSSPKPGVLMGSHRSPVNPGRPLGMKLTIAMPPRSGVLTWPTVLKHWRGIIAAVRGVDLTCTQQIFQDEKVVGETDRRQRLSSSHTP